MIAQILLAAGKSTRMGFPKPLLDFDGVPLLSLLLQECRRSDVQQIIVVLGCQQHRIIESVDLSGTTVVVNEDYEQGQTGSLQRALLAMDPGAEAFLNLPVDYPLVTHCEINALVDAFRARNPREKLFIPTYKDCQGRPVLFERSLRDVVLGLGPNDPVSHLFAQMGDSVRPVPVSNPYTAIDVDTPEQYRACLEIYRSARHQEALSR